MSKDNKLSESSVRLWRVAVEQELLNPRQIQRCQEVLAQKQAAGITADLGDIMVEQGYLTREQLVLVRAEERKRRLRIKGYEILQRIGAGAVGTVYRARQINMEREVALKILNPELARNKAAVDKYISEARAVARLSHPHIVQGIDVGASGGLYYFAMEYLPGGTFAQLLEASGPLKEDDAMVYLYQVASALDHAWQQRIIHCDIKPANLMLDAAGRLKLTDLGLARVQDEESTGTQTGKRVVHGTPLYVSPEQITSPGNIDCRADIYSLGVTFYHLLSGAPPFSGKSAKAIMLARLKRNPAPLGEVCPEMNQRLADLIDRMISREPENRPQTPDALKNEILKLGVNIDSTGDLLGAIRKRTQTGPRPSARARIRGRQASGQRQKKTSKNKEADKSKIWVYIIIVAAACLCFLLAWLLLC